MSVETSVTRRCVHCHALNEIEMPSNRTGTNGTLAWRCTHCDCSRSAPVRGQVLVAGVPTGSADGRTYHRDVSQSRAWIHDQAQAVAGQLRLSLERAEWRADDGGNDAMHYLNLTVGHQ